MSSGAARGGSRRRAQPAIDASASPATAVRPAAIWKGGDERQLGRGRQPALAGPQREGQGEPAAGGVAGQAEGTAACLALVAASMDGGWGMAATRANGQPAALAWWHGAPFGGGGVTVAGDGIAAVTVFADPGLVPRFAALSRPA